MNHTEPNTKSAARRSTNQYPSRRGRSKTYPLTEFELTKISKLFGCLEEAIKEIIRNGGRDDPDYLSEMYFYEMTSRALLETDDSELPGSLDLARGDDFR